jgi:hypothetical protein
MLSIENVAVKYPAFLFLAVHDLSFLFSVRYQYSVNTNKKCQTFTAG